MHKLTHIVVPINGTPEDDNALTLGCMSAKRNKAKLTVLFVVEVKRSLPVDAEMPHEFESGQRLLDEAEEMARKLDCTVSTDMLQARSAGPAIVDEARALAADLIVMGLPYHTQFGAYQLSDSANYVLSYAPCRVWLVRDRLDTPEEIVR